MGISDPSSGGKAMDTAEEYTRETPMVELAYFLLRDLSHREPMSFEDIATRVLAQKGYMLDDVAHTAQLYTAMNVDGRFIHVGNGQWGLKDWYPFDKYEELIPSYEEEDGIDEAFLEIEDEELLPLALEEEEEEEEESIEDIEKDLLLPEEPLDEEILLPEEEEGLEREEEMP